MVRTLGTAFVSPWFTWISWVRADSYTIEAIWGGEGLYGPSGWSSHDWKSGTLAPFLPPHPPRSGMDRKLMNGSIKLTFYEEAFNHRPPPQKKSESFWEGEHIYVPECVSQLQEMKFLPHICHPQAAHLHPLLFPLSKNNRLVYFLSLSAREHCRTKKSSGNLETSWDWRLA